MLTSRFRINKLNLDQKGSQKSQYSCFNCRKLKRKCSKTLPVCYNCQNTKKTCTYLGRKQRKPQRLSFLDELSPDETDQPGSHEIPSDDNSVSNTTVAIEALNNLSFIRETSNVSETSSPQTNFSVYTLGLTQLDMNKSELLVTPKVTKELCGKFVEAFFKHNHRSYPFICESQFLQAYDDLEYINDTISNYFEFEIYMVMAIGCTTLSRVGLMKKENNYSKFFSYRAVAFLMQGFEISNIESIKMLLLLCIYSFFEPQGLHSWNISGMISRASITLGLNKRLTNDEPRTLEVEMRYRLFWSIYNMDRLLSISLGKPLGIDELNIDIPLPQRLSDEAQFVYKTINSIINLRTIEGNIIKKIYSIRSREVYNEETINDLKIQLDDWFNANKPNLPSNLKFFSFHGSDLWYSTRYYHDLMLLYRPSYLIPKPHYDQSNLLGEYCLKTLSSTHKLYKLNLLPLNWITLYRFLTLCSTTLFCLCNWSIDLNQSRSEIYLSVEVLNAFSENWVFADKCSKVFQNIVDNILEISITASGDEVSSMQQLSCELLGASSAYHDILNDNSINVSFTL